MRTKKKKKQNNFYSVITKKNEFKWKIHRNHEHKIKRLLYELGIDLEYGIANKRPLINTIPSMGYVIANYLLFYVSECVKL